jgi:hypothetical protein
MDGLCSPGANGHGWRVPLGALWEEVALDAGCGVETRAAGGRSRRLLQATSVALVRGLDVRGA